MSICKPVSPVWQKQPGQGERGEAGGPEEAGGAPEGGGREEEEGDGAAHAPSRGAPPQGGGGQEGQGRGGGACQVSSTQKIKKLCNFFI